MNIYDSYIEAGQKLGRGDREKFYTAVIEFLAYGTEPELKGAPLAIMTAIRPSLEDSRRSLVNGRKGGRPRKTQNAENAKPEPRETENQNGEKPETQTRENRETQAADFGKAKDKDKSNKEKEPPKGGSKEKGSAPRFKPPSVDEVAAYAGQAGLPLDAGRFCDFYASKGWRVGSSPMRDWRAACRNWARRNDGPGRFAAAEGVSADEELEFYASLV